MRVWLRQKKANKDLRKHYLLIFQSSLAVVIGLFVIAFNINMAGNKQAGEDSKVTEHEQETIEVREVVRTKQQSKSPRPPSPQPPVEAPDHKIVESEAQNKLKQLDQQLNSGQKLSVPPKPEEPSKNEKVFKVVEQQPKLIGGLDTLQQMINYPTMARKAEIQGRVYVQFVINKQGKVENPKVIRGPGAGLNKEALRVINKARFRPGIQAGHPVKVRYTMPVIFQLNQNERS